MSEVKFTLAEEVHMDALAMLEDAEAFRSLAYYEHAWRTTLAEVEEHTAGSTREDCWSAIVYALAVAWNRETLAAYDRVAAAAGGDDELLRIGLDVVSDEMNYAFNDGPLRERFPNWMLRRAIVAAVAQIALLLRNPEEEEIHRQCHCEQSWLDRASDAGLLGPRT